MKQPVRKLDVAVPGALGMAKSLYEGVVAGAVQFARYGFNTDVSHGGPSCSIAPPMLDT
jgi:hypothetical protein